MPRVYRSALRLAAALAHIGVRAALPSWGALALAPSSKAAPFAKTALAGCAALALLHVIMFAMALAKQWANAHERAWNEARAEHSRPRGSSATDEFGMLHRGWSLLRRREPCFTGNATGSTDPGLHPWHR